MRREPTETPLPDPVAEARRYVQNAKDVLRNNTTVDPETQCYSDSKYVRMAGNTLWNGILLLLDALFQVKASSDSRPDIRDYRQAIAIRDKKLLTLVDSGYDTLHLAMGYDGNPRKAVCDDGFQLANQIIERCEKMLPLSYHLENKSLLQK